MNVLPSPSICSQTPLGQGVVAGDLGDVPALFFPGDADAGLDPRIGPAAQSKLVRAAAHRQAGARRRRRAGRVDAVLAAPPRSWPAGSPDWCRSA